MEQESKIADIGPDSAPENSTSIKRPIETILNLLMEVCDRQMLRDSWNGPFSSKEERLRSYDVYQWPRDVKPKPDALSEAGFFAIGEKFKTTFLNKKMLTVYTFKKNCSYRFGRLHEMFYVWLYVEGVASDS